MSATLGCRNVSPSRQAAWTTTATIVASESASCVTRRSGPRRLKSLRLMVRPKPTAALENSSAAVPAARLVIQKRWSWVIAVFTEITVPAGAGRRPSASWEAPERERLSVAPQEPDRRERDRQHRVAGKEREPTPGGEVVRVVERRRGDRGAGVERQVRADAVRHRARQDRVDPGQHEQQEDEERDASGAGAPPR